MATNGQPPVYGQQANTKVFPGSEIKLISGGQIEYVGIGDNNIKAISNPQTVQWVTTKLGKVGNDDTLIPVLKRKG